MKRKVLSLILALSMLATSLTACGSDASSDDATGAEEVMASADASGNAAESAQNTQVDPTSALDKGIALGLEGNELIEYALNLANNDDQEWTFGSDAWTLSIVSAVAYPVIAKEEGVSVCVPASYVKGIDTNGDGEVDITSETAEGAVKGSLVIDYEAEVVSENGQVYTATTAPLILNTGAAGYGNQSNQKAGSTYAKQGYINIACGNRGKQDFYTDENGDTVYTGDAPSCLVDQKAAARFVKYNILLGNLPGNVDYLVTTGGSGGGAHATMFAATSNNEDFYDYQIEVGAVGVYKLDDGSYSTEVTVDDMVMEISDGAWGCIAYSAITSLYEGDITMALEYYLDTDYSFATSFQKTLAGYLSESYMNYVNEQSLSVEEAQVGFDLNNDGDMDDTIALSIEYDEEKYADTNGYGGSYLDLYLAEFVSDLQWYIDNLDYAEGWTWFDAEGNALSDSEVASMTLKDKAEAFINGRVATSSEGEMGGPGGGPSGGMGGPGGAAPGAQMAVGTPDAGTTQSASGGSDSANYGSYDELLKAYEEDIAEVNEGDRFGKNQVYLYNPLNYIGADGTDSPTWTRIMMGASEGDISMFCSLNLQIAWLLNGTDSTIEWQWNGGHVPSEILGESLALTVDTMYGKYVEGASEITKAEAGKVTANGTATEPTAEDISSWVTVTDDESKASGIAVSFSLSDAASYRTAGASKAIPGFDVIDYGQEDYVFGSDSRDARHWDSFVLEVLKENAEVLSPLFNAE